MNLYEKVIEILKLNKVREKDIVMAHKYTQKRILIIAPELLKKSLSEYNYDDIDFDNMVDFIIFGLDYITQKGWILAIFGDITTWKFFKRDTGYCKEFFVNSTTQKLLRDKIDEQIEELAIDFQVNNTNARLVKVLSEYFKYKPSEEDKKRIIADSLMKINNDTKKLYDRNQRLCWFLQTRGYNYDNSSLYDTAMKEFSLYDKEDDKEQNNMITIKDELNNMFNILLNNYQKEHVTGVVFKDTYMGLYPHVYSWKDFINTFGNREYTVICGYLEDKDTMPAIDIFGLSEDGNAWVLTRNNYYCSDLQYGKWKIKYIKGDFDLDNEKLILHVSGELEKSSIEILDNLKKYQCKNSNNIKES